MPHERRMLACVCACVCVCVRVLLCISVRNLLIT